MARLVVLAAVLLCALPAAAQARSFSLPTQMRDVNFRPGIETVDPEGPALAGDSVVWWDRRGDEAFLMVGAAGSDPRRILTVPAARGPQLTVAASGNRGIAQRRNSFYEVDVAAGTARRMDPCFGDAACAACRADSGSSEFRYELVGTVLATGQRWVDCLSGVVHDFADGATRAFPGPVLAAAGTYAVVEGPSDVALYNWRTGQRLRTVDVDSFGPAARRRVAVDADGTVAIAGDVERTTHNPFGASDEIRLAGGLLAQRRVIADEELDEEFGARSRTRFWISRPDGSATRRVSGQRFGGGWDFDGRRVAWATQPCAEVRIQVWDLADDPPRPASEKCGVPRIRRAKLISHSGVVWYKATCPRRPARGCDGELRAVLRRAGGGRRVGATHRFPIHLRAGETDRNGLAVEDPVALRRIPGPFRGRFIFTSHGRRSAATHAVPR
jgi:hypothetical protein